MVQVPTTIVDYTTALTTCYETTEVYTTESCIETDYTTVSAGSTIVIRKSRVYASCSRFHADSLPEVTETNTIEVTSVYTVTST